MSTLRTQPDKAVSLGCLQDGHVEQLHRVHFARHVAFLKRKKKDGGGGGGEGRGRGGGGVDVGRGKERGLSISVSVLNATC